jgi:Lrp/AsnC family transcriptional regulator, leucine-responsive regulatory protein
MTSSHRPDFDDTDRSILQELQTNGRLTNAELAQRINLSASATLRRVKRLEDIGVITGYRAVVDENELGLGTTVFVEMRLDSQREEVLAAFEAAAAAIPEVVGCHLISGDADYLLRVQAGGVSGFEQIHTQKLARLPGVVQIRSYFAMRSVFDRATRPLGPP